jgi:predicted O-methyltransferase YrrM
MKNLLKSLTRPARLGRRPAHVRQRLLPSAERAAWSAQALCQQVHGGNVFTGFPHEDYPQDLQGWNSEAPVFRRLLGELRPQRVVELGTWKGGSAIHMCNLAAELQLDPFVLVCVDTFLGGAWHWQMREHRDGYPSLACRHGHPNLYFQFLANVVKSGHTERIVPFPNTTDVAAEYFASIGFVALDLVYVDARHTEEAVYADIRDWWPLVRSGGVVFGDDFIPQFPGVEQAVCRFCQEHALRFDTCGEKWIVRKP